MNLDEVVCEVTKGNNAASVNPRGTDPLQHCVRRVSLAYSPVPKLGTKLWRQGSFQARIYEWLEGICFSARRGHRSAFF
jgi:hypothetical protein